MNLHLFWQTADGTPAHSDVCWCRVGESAHYLEGAYAWMPLEIEADALPLGMQSAIGNGGPYTDSTSGPEVKEKCKRTWHHHYQEGAGARCGSCTFGIGVGEKA